MSITLRSAQEDVIAEVLRSGAYQNPDEVIDQALEMLREQNAWLTQNRQSIDTKIKQGIQELDEGKFIHENDLTAYLERLKAMPE